MFAVKLILIILSFCDVHARTDTQADVELNSSLVKLTPTAALGQCLPSGNPSNIAELLRRNNIEVSTGNLPGDRGPASSVSPLSDLNDTRVIAVARIVAAYEGLGNGSMDALRSGEKINIIFANSSSSCRNSRRYESQIQLCPGNQNRQGMNGVTEHGGVDNLALIAHEIAHYVGGCQDGKRYNDYNTYMAGSKCAITNYAGENPQEEFAEVMAAYLTMPQAFIEKGPDCEKAFRFMRTLFGESTELSLNESPSRLCEIRQASYQPGQPALTRTAELQQRQGTPTRSPQLPVNPSVVPRTIIPATGAF